jgi:hypothetical protein
MVLRGRWRNIAIALIDLGRPILGGCYRLISKSKQFLQLVRKFDSVGVPLIALVLFL